MLLCISKHVRVPLDDFTNRSCFAQCLFNCVVLLVRQNTEKHIYASTCLCVIKMRYNGHVNARFQVTRILAFSFIYVSSRWFWAIEFSHGSSKDKLLLQLLHFSWERASHCTGIALNQSLYKYFDVNHPWKSLIRPAAFKERECTRRKHDTLLLYKTIWNVCRFNRR